MILILNNNRQSLLIFKSLKKLNIPFIVGSSLPMEPWIHSRYCEEVWYHTDFKNEKMFSKELLGFLELRNEIDAIYPIGEMALITVSNLIEQISSKIKVFMPQKESVNLCLNKKKCSDMIHSLNIPNANSILISNPKDLLPSAESCGYPVIFKPNFSVNSLKNEKAIIVRNKNAMNLVVQQWSQTAPILMEKYIIGERISVNLVVKNGEICNFLQNLILQTQEIDGTGFTVRTCSMKPSEVLQTYVSKIVYKLKYTGIINIQFILNQQDKKYYFIEINPRIPATTALIYKTGTNVAEYTLHVYEYRINPLFKKQIYKIENITCNWFYGDLSAYIKHLFRGQYSFTNAFTSLYKLIIAALKSDIDQAWYLDDIKPSLITIIRPLLVRLNINKLSIK